jgi:hypothetical protein
MKAVRQVISVYTCHIQRMHQEVTQRGIASDLRLTPNLRQRTLFAHALAHIRLSYR